MSILKQQVKAFVQLNAPSHVASNARRYTWRTWTAEPNYNMLGGVSYLRPSEGAVVASDNQFTLVKTGRSSFDVISTHLLDSVVNIGDKLALSFYQLRRFDGTMADGSEDLAVNGILTTAITGARTQFPVNWEGRYLGSTNEEVSSAYRSIQNPYLRDMINQIETLPLDDGSDRKLVNVLIDAGASQLTFVDPPEAQSCDTPPSIAMHFEKAKFAEGEPGDLRIEYDRAMDTYTVFKMAAGLVEQINHVHFPELPEKISDALDDGSWAMVKVTVLKKAPVKREKRVAEAA